MFGFILIAAIASIFYYIGNHEYHGKGGLLATLSVVLSLAISYLIPLGFLGVIGINVLLFIGLFIYNLTAKRPPGSRSGF